MLSIRMCSIQVSLRNGDIVYFFIRSVFAIEYQCGGETKVIQTHHSLKDMVVLTFKQSTNSHRANVMLKVLVATLP